MSENKVLGDSYESDFTQDDAFELDGCGITAVNRSTARRFVANMPRLVVRARARKDALEAEYERGYEDGRCEALGFEVE